MQLKQKEEDDGAGGSVGTIGFIEGALGPAGHQQQEEEEWMIGGLGVLWCAVCSENEATVKVSEWNLCQECQEYMVNEHMAWAQEAPAGSDSEEEPNRLCSCQSSGTAGVSTAESAPRAAGPDEVDRFHQTRDDDLVNVVLGAIMPTTRWDYKRDIMVDSGAFLSIVPPWFGAGEVKKEVCGKQIKTVRGGLIPRYCKKTLKRKLQQGGRIADEFIVGDVELAVSSVSKMVDTRNLRVVFDCEEDGGAYMLNKQTGTTRSLTRKGGVWALETELEDEDFNQWMAPGEMAGPQYAAVTAMEVEPTATAPVASSSAQELFRPEASLARALKQAETDAAKEEAATVVRLDEERSAEIVRAKAPRKPTEPSAEERQNDLTHILFRPWCPLCVEGKAQGRAHHLAQEEPETALPVIQWDYCFAGRKGELSRVKILTGRDMQSKSTFTVQVQVKGSGDECAARAAADWVDELGYPSVILQHDPEPALADLMNQVRLRRKGGQTQVRETPKESKGSLGGAERAHAAVQGELRTLETRGDEVQYSTVDRNEPAHALGRPTYRLAADAVPAWMGCKDGVAAKTRQSLQRGDCSIYRGCLREASLDAASKVRAQVVARSLGW